MTLDANTTLTAFLYGCLAASDAAAAGAQDATCSPCQIPWSKDPVSWADKVPKSCGACRIGTGSRPPLARMERHTRAEASSALHNLAWVAGAVR